MEEFAFKAPVFAIFNGNKAVSVCHNSRKYSSAAAAGVYTFREFRGLGFATEVTRAWAMELQRTGQIALRH